MEDWQERLGGDLPSRLPKAEARLVLEAVGAFLRDRSTGGLDRAGVAWGRAHAGVEEMVGPIPALRDLAQGRPESDRRELSHALDRIIVAATGEMVSQREQDSHVDVLTGIGNRWALDRMLRAVLSASIRQGHPLSVAVVDLDGLKSINDRLGHPAGDGALVALVGAIVGELRGADGIFRIGGDEFVVVLPFTASGEAEVVMGRVAAGDGPAFSWGVAGCPGDGVEAPVLIGVADADLYRRRQERRGLPAQVPPAVRPTRRSSIGGALAGAAAVLAVAVAVTFVGVGGLGRGDAPSLLGRSAPPTSVTPPPSTAAPGGATPPTTARTSPAPPSPGPSFSGSAAPATHSGPLAVPTNPGPTGAETTTPPSRTPAPSSAPTLTTGPGSTPSTAPAPPTSLPTTVPGGGRGLPSPPATVPPGGSGIGSVISTIGRILGSTPLVGPLLGGLLK